MQIRQVFRFFAILSLGTGLALATDSWTISAVEADCNACVYLYPGIWSCASVTPGTPHSGEYCKVTGSSCSPQGSCK